MLEDKSDEIIRAEKIGDPFWMLIEACERFKDEP
jgi:hypothetical protein